MEKCGRRAGPEIGFGPATDRWDLRSKTLRRIVLSLIVILAVAVMAVAALFLRLSQGPVSLGFMQGRIEEAINISDRYKKSHLAMVVNAGLQDIQAAGNSANVIDSAKRALQRATAIKTAEFKRGLSALATIGSTAPFVGLFGTVVGIINSFQGMKSAESTGIGAVAGGISEALIETAFGLIVAVPAVWMYNYFSSKVESFVVEMDNSSSELIDYFLKQRGA